MGVGLVAVSVCVSASASAVARICPDVCLRLSSCSLITDCWLTVGLVVVTMIYYVSGYMPGSCHVKISPSFHAPMRLVDT